MDVNDLRSAVTVLLFALFAGIVAWVLAPRNKARFDAAQQLPFLDEAPAHTDTYANAGPDDTQGHRP